MYGSMKFAIISHKRINNIICILYNIVPWSKNILTKIKYNRYMKYVPTIIFYIPIFVKTEMKLV